MTTLAPRPAPQAGTPSTSGSQPPGRDRAVDLVRAGLMLWVVTFHALMVGAWAPGGAPSVGNALEGWSGFDALTWAGQIMPLFFLLAGFSAAASGRGKAGSKHDGAGRLGARLLRLVPAVAAGALSVTLGLALLASAGLDPALLAEAGFRSAQPLWFLPVFALCTALAPTALRLHRAAPRATLAALAAAALAVDVVRALTGNDAVGLANMVFVWLALQQAGFLLHSPVLTGLRPARLLTLAAACASMLALLVWAGVYPSNFIEAMTPPTTALLLLGAAQLFLFQAVRPVLNAAVWPGGLSRAVAAINAHAMTIYSWHLPLAVALAGLSLAWAGPLLPAPTSAAWWATRPLWFAAVGLTLWWLASRGGRTQRLGARVPGAAPAAHLATAPGLPATLAGNAGRPSRPTAVVRWILAVAGTASAVAGPLLILVLGGTGPAWVLGSALLCASVAAARRAARPAEQARAS
ncbi:acyltransferase [Galactobacter valiniphilus]|uniref:Acyltransferase n=1 Tax=Galactobacter valiniphilus TaxID=2676122 RepID=A0A399JDW2_9MICC|nr:acyltransferase [Galactobacter valiniphilus]RII43751.1 acyltransferase [Galactobacter valiniphilus]